MRIVVISGTVGSGKTTVAEAIHDELVGRGLASAYIDVDILCEAEPRRVDDPYNQNLGFANLASMIGNYRDFGVEYLVLARVVEDAADRGRYEQALGDPVRIVRLEADLETRIDRLTSREDVDAWREWHLNRTEELAAKLRNLAVEDFVVSNDGRLPAQTANEILGLLRWLD